VKKILILTAGFGEGHNSAGRGIRDGLRKVAPAYAQVELHDLFAETYGPINDWARVLYLGMINQTPPVWRSIYRWLDRQQTFVGDFRVFYALKNRLARMLDRLQPDIVISVYPAYSHMLDELFGNDGAPQHKRVVVITDSISVNAIWYRCNADYFLVPNEQSTAPLLRQGIPPDKIRTFGFPVSPIFAQPAEVRSSPSDADGRRVLYIINSDKSAAPALVRRLAGLCQIQLTVTVGRNAGLKVSVDKIRRTVTQEFETVAWSDELPRLLQSNHLVISKAGGATVQEAMAASCPIVVNHIIPGQEEGNARLILETNSGAIATTHDEVIAAVQRAFANDAVLWREWSNNIGKLGRPTASLEIAQFLLSI
jgi:processive 1,2-diacylglycerol beta-glucosyltransferase